MSGLYEIQLHVGYDKTSANNNLQQLIIELKKNKLELSPNIDFARAKVEFNKEMGKMSTDLMKTFNKLDIGLPKLDPKQSLKLVTQQYKETVSAIKQAEKEQQNLNKLQNQANKSTQGNYYGKIKQNIIEIIQLEKQKVAAGQEELAVINAQIKRLQERNRYNTKQLDSKGLKDKTLDNDVQQLQKKLALQNQIIGAKSKDSIVSTQEKASTAQASAQLNQQISSLNKILALKAQIASKSPNKNQSELSYLQQQLLAEQKNYNALSQQSSQYDQIISKEERRRALTEATAKSAEKLNTINSRTNDKTRESSIRAENAALSDQAKIQANLTKLNLQKGTVKSNIDAFLSTNTKLSTNTVQAKALMTAFQQLRASIDSVDDVKSLDNLKLKLSTLKNETKAAGLIGKNFTNELKNDVSKLFNWVSASFIMFQAFGKIREAVVELKAVDHTLTEISKTSDRTAASLNALGISAFNTASDYGRKATDYLFGVQEMSRAGFNESGSEEMAELSILAQSAGDMSAELSNKYLIATDAAYRLGGSVEALNAILDGQNQITNRNAVNMEEMANATKVAASQLANSNVEVNEASALLGTGIATTQEGGETVGRAVKGILMNLQQVKGETGFDGDIIDEDSLKKVEKRCYEVGVSLETMKNGFTALRDPMEVLKELADVYNSLPDDSTQKAGIISDIGGKYRGNVLSSILSNWDKYEKMLGDYENSSGSAMGEAMKSANNWEGTLNKLSNTWTGFIQNFVNTDVVKGAINIFNGLIKVLDLVTTKIGGLGTLGVVGGIYSGLRNTGLVKTTDSGQTVSVFNAKKVAQQELLVTQQKMSEQLRVDTACLTKYESVAKKGTVTTKNFNKIMKGASATAQEHALQTKGAAGSAQVFVSKQNEAATALTATGAAASRASIGMTALNVAMNVGIMLAISAAISGLVKLYDHFTTRQERAIEAGKKLEDSYKSSTTTISDNISKVKSLQDEFNKLSTGVNDNSENISLSEQEYARYKEIINEIIGVSPTLVSRFDEEGNAIANKNDLIERSIELLEEERRTKLSEATSNDNNWTIAQAKIASMKKLEKESAEESAKVVDSILSVVGNDMITDSMGNQIKGMSDDVLKEFIKTYGLIEDEVSKAQTSDNLSYLYALFTNEDNIDILVSKLNEDFSSLNQFVDDYDMSGVNRQFASYTQAATKADVAARGYRDQLLLIAQSSTDYSSLSKGQKSFIDTYVDSFELTGKEKQSDIQGMTDDILYLIEHTLKNSPVAKVKMDELFKLSLDKDNLSVDDYIKQYKALVDTIISSLYGDSDSEEANALKVKLNFEIEDETKLKKEVNDKVENLGLTDTKRKIETLNSSELSIFYKIVNAKDSDYESFDALWDDYLKKQGEAALADSTNPFASIQSNVEAFMSTYSSLNEMLSSQSTGTGISLEEFNSAELSEYQNTLEYVNGTMQINQEKVKELVKAKSEEQLATIEAADAQNKTDYSNNARQIELLTQKLKDKNFAQGETTETVEASISALQKEQGTIVDECDNYAVLASNLREATGAYQEWKNAQNSPESGDMYRDTLTALANIKEGLKTGKVGTEKYTSSVEFLVPEAKQGDVSKYVKSLSRYLKADASDGINNFISDAVSKGLMSEDKNGEVTIAANKTMADFAAAMTLPEEVVQSIFGELEEYGAKFDWGDEFIKNFDDAFYTSEQTIVNLQTQLDQLKANPKVNKKEIKETEVLLKEALKAKTELENQSIVNVDTRIDIDDKIESTKDKLNKLKDEASKDPANIDIQAKVTQAKAELESLNKKKKELGKPTAIEINAALSGVEKELGSLEKKKKNLSNKKYLIKMNISQGDAKKQLSKIDEQITSLTKKKKTYTTYLNINTKKATSNIKKAEKDIDKIDLKLGKDRKLTIETSIAKERLVEIQEYLRKIKSKKISINVNKSTETTDSSTPSTKPVTGTGEVTGTSKNKIAGKTLIGEIDREIVLDPQTGKWRTYGDNGAEFIDMPQNAVVFNHKQTQSLLDRGFVNGRGSSIGNIENILSGDGFVTGSFNRGNINKNTVSAQKKRSKKGKKKSDGSTSSTDSWSESLDWLAQKLEDISNRVSVFNAKLDNSTALKTQISLYQKLIKEQTRSAYWNEKSADVYKSKYKSSLKGLSKSDQQKVQSGAYTIENFKDVVKKEKGDSNKTGANQKRLEKIQSALDFKGKYYSATQGVYTSKAQVKSSAAELAGLRRTKGEEKKETITSKIELNKATVDNTASYKEKNKLLETQLSLQKQILSTQKAIVTGNKSDIASSGKELLKLSKDKNVKSVVDKNAKSKNPDDLKLINTTKLTGKAYAAAATYNAYIKELKGSQDDYNKSLQDTQKELAAIANEQFDNINEEYEYKKGNITRTQTQVQNDISLAEAKGQQLGTTYYTKLIELQTQSIATLEKERKEKQKALDLAVKTGQIKVDSAEWRKMNNDIADISLSMQDLTISTTEFNNALRQLKWDSFDKLLGKFDQLTTEANFLVGLMADADMFNDKGKITAEGLATQGQHALNYNTYMQKADLIKNELATLDANSTDQNVINRIQELTSQRQDAITAAMNEKKAVLDLAREGIQAEIDAMGELIDKNKEAIDQEKKKKDDAKTIADKLKEVERIKKLINALEGDDSAENKKKLRELRQQLSDAQEDLDETQYDQGVEKRKEDLDKQLDDYTKKMEDYSDNSDKLFTDTLKNINAQSTAIGSTIQSTAQKVGYTISTDITKAWSNAGNAVSEYNTTFTNQSAGILKVLASIKTQWDAIAASAEQAAINSLNAMNGGSSSGTTNTQSDANEKIKSDLIKILTNANGTGNNNSVLNQYVMKKGYHGLSYQNMADLAKVLGYKSVTDKTMVNDRAMKDKILAGLKKYIPGFSTGGVVTDIIKHNNDDGLATVKKGEVVLTKDFTKLMPEATQKMYDFTKLPTINPYMPPLPNYQSAGATGQSSFTVAEGAVQLNIQVEKPINADDLVNQLSKNDRVKQSIHDITVGEIISKRSQLVT